MTNCKNCGAPLKIVNGKCAYCGTDYGEPPTEVRFVHAHEKGTLCATVSVPYTVMRYLNDKQLDRYIKTALAKKFADKMVEDGLIVVRKSASFTDPLEEEFGDTYVGLITVKTPY